MKFTFDSENFLAGKGRSILSIVLFIIAAFLIFHLGVICGMHRQFYHRGFGSYGQYQGGDQQFNVRTSDGTLPMMQRGQDTIYYDTNSMMDPNFDPSSPSVGRAYYTQ